MGDPTIVRFEKGDCLDGWTVQKLLGEGGFGAVYEVTKGNESCAMKTEYKNEATKVLKMEVYVVKLLNKANAKHFVTCADTGIYQEKIFYFIMSKIGKCLQDLRKMLPGQRFSVGCAISVGIQSVEAIEELHGIGYLHRDIKPSNYAIGLPPDGLRTVYMFDFGMARSFLDANKQIRMPRASVGFRGTVRYAPLSCHIRRDTSRKDDLESWLYQQVEITRGALPWRSVDDRNEVAMFKERCRYGINLQEMMGGCPREYIEIMRYIDNIRYYDVPNYKKIYKLLKASLSNLKMKEYPYDWENLQSVANPNYK